MHHIRTIQHLLLGKYKLLMTMLTDIISAIVLIGTRSTLCVFNKQRNNRKKKNSSLNKS